jgi:hypothetical protein
MTKRSQYERQRNAQASARIKEIEQAWWGSLSSDKKQAFTAQVEAARERGPAERPPDMAPGTLPNPPRPGHEPKPPKAERRPRSRRS